MTLLAIAQDVADIVGVTRPVALVNGNDQIARQMLGLARETLRELGRMDWPNLEIPYTFNTVVAQEEYTLPADFGREVGDTVYVASQYPSLRGSLTPGDWQRQRSGLQAELGRYRFRIFGLTPTLHITPTPGVVEAMIMEYQTTYRVRQVDGTYKNTYFADDDVSLVPEDLVSAGLKWRLRRAKGLDYSEDFNDYEISRANMLAQALGLGSMPVAYRYGDDGIGGLIMPETGYGS